MSSLARRAIDFWKGGKGYRTQFGILRGTSLSIQLRRDYTNPKGTRFPVSIPGLPCPILFRAGTSDILVAREHLLQRPLDFPLSGDPRFIIDAGANIGLVSVYLAHRYPRARIVALEVDDGNFDILQENVRLFPNITPLRRGLWSERGYLRILNPTDPPWQFRVGSARPGDPGAIESVDVGSLLEEFSAPRVDLLKVDIEGAELAVLSAPDLSWLDRVGVLALELHDRLRPGCSEALERALVGRPHSREMRTEYMVIRLAQGASYPTVSGRA